MRAATLVISVCLLLCLIASAAGQGLPDTPSVTRIAAVDAEPMADALAAPLTGSPFVVNHGVSYVKGPPEQPRRKIMDRNFVALGALTFGLTAMDVEMTQHCLHEKTCVELNPTLPHSRIGMYAANTPVNMAVMYWSYKRKAAGRRAWWVAPLVDIGAHAVGIGSNIRFLR
jgi:hypothetical protein